MSDVRELAEWLAPLQEVLLRHGYRRLHIGGSSAREILDHVRCGTDLALRDLDVYLLKHATVHAADLHALCDALRESVPTPAGATSAELPRLRAQVLCGSSTFLDALLATAPLVFGVP